LLRTAKWLPRSFDRHLTVVLNASPGSDRHGLGPAGMLFGVVATPVEQNPGSLPGRPGPVGR
jgi:hypothetical protein